MTASPISTLLLRETLPTVLRCLYSPFVYGLASGKLPLSSFSNYVGQDAFFLNAFATAYKSAGDLATRQGDDGGAKEFQSLAAGVADELQLHKTYAAKWSVDLSGVVPNAVTQAYCGFVGDMAAAPGSAEGAFKVVKISHLCAALAPCMRLYAYLGSTLAAAGYAQEPDALRDNPYAEWINTYKTDEFEGLARKLEDLLDNYAAREQETVETLLPIYSRAMTLELAFFGAQPDAQTVAVPFVKPSLFAVDFDQTLTERDTSAMIVSEAIAALPTEEQRGAMQRAFDAVAADFYAKYTAKVAEALAAHPRTSDELDAASLRRFCEDMAVFDVDALRPVVEGGFLKGISRQNLEASGRRVELQAHAVETLRASATSGAALHVISVNWSKDLILAALKHHLHTSAASGSSRAPLHTSAASLSLHDDLRLVDLHSPDLVFSEEEDRGGGVRAVLSTGALSGPPSTSVDKLEIMQSLLLGAGGAARGRVVYVGDSVTDLLALLAADVGIVVGSSATLLRVAHAYNIQMRPLIGSISAVAQEGGRGGACDGDGNRESERASEQGPRVLYTAASWHDICFALFGTEALPWGQAAVF